MVRRSTINGTIFEYIPLEDIRCAYERIEQDLHKVKEKAYVDWIPADVYATLKVGNADLFIGYEKDNYVGFFIISILKNAGGEPYLFLWIGYSAKFKSELKDNGFLFLDKLAEEYKVSSIEFSSGRLGAERSSRKHGYKEIARTYRKEM